MRQSIAGITKTHGESRVFLLFIIQFIAQAKNVLISPASVVFSHGMFLALSPKWP
jgi:hypothetical protein